MGSSVGRDTVIGSKDDGTCSQFQTKLCNICEELLLRNQFIHDIPASVKYVKLIIKNLIKSSHL